MDRPYYFHLNEGKKKKRKEKPKKNFGIAEYSHSPNWNLESFVWNGIIISVEIHIHSLEIVRAIFHVHYCYVAKIGRHFYGANYTGLVSKFVQFWKFELI